MRRKILTLACILGISFGRGIVAEASDWTLVVTPVRYSVMQVLFDLLRMRPVVLVSWQAPIGQAEPTLHAWNGQEWVPITLRDLGEVRFLQVVPRRVILLGDPNSAPPAILRALTWSQEIIQVSELDTPSLVNSLGRLFRFEREEWAWMAARYRLAVEDVNEPLRRRSWYRDRSIDLPRPKIPFFRRFRPTGADSAPVQTSHVDTTAQDLPTLVAPPLAAGGASQPAGSAAEALERTPAQASPAAWRNIEPLEVDTSGLK